MQKTINAVPDSPALCRPALLLLLLAALLFCCSCCSVRQRALRSFADALGTDSADVFTTEDDLGLVEGALPFSLKAMESVLAEVPDHTGLCLSLARGYMLYTYAFVEQRADEAKYADFDAYRRSTARARRLYRRAHQYALRGLGSAEKEFEALSAESMQKALGRIRKEQDAELLYWAGASLAKWISLSKSDPAAVARLPEAAAFMQRALEIQPGYDRGAIHEFFISYAAGGPGGGETDRRIQEHFQAALKLADGRKASPQLTYVEAVSIPGQNRPEFDRLIQQILSFEIDRHPRFRLANTVAKRRARFLWEHRQDLFIGEVK